MVYLMVWVFPPFGLLLLKRPVSALIALAMCFTLFLWPVAAIWAYVLVAEHNADRRTRRIVRAVGGRSRY